MNYLKNFSTCLVVLAFTGAAWAEIYETTDAQGNPEFTDSPTDEDAKVIDLPETNLANAPTETPQEQEQEQSNPAPAGGPRVVNNNNTVINENGYGSGYDDGEYGDGEYDRARRREGLDREAPLDRDAIPEGLHAETPLDPSAPHEVLDGEPLHEVGDFDEPQRAVDQGAVDQGAVDRGEAHRRVIHHRR